MVICDDNCPVARLPSCLLKFPRDVAPIRIRSFVLCETRESDGKVAVDPFGFQGYLRQMELG